MRRSRFTEQQIVVALRQAESGTPVVEVCRKLGIIEQTFYRWKRKFAGMGVAELRRLREVEEENRRLKQLVADLTFNAYVESFNGHLREECLNQHWFETLAEAREMIEARRVDSNTERPHRALGQQAPSAVQAGWELLSKAAD